MMNEYYANVSAGEATITFKVQSYSDIDDAAEAVQAMFPMAAVWLEPCEE